MRDIPGDDSVRLLPAPDNERRLEQQPTNETIDKSVVN